ncbi:MAG: hypothetical protein ABIR79_09515 [Candidatus Binatia bacterium]
MRSLMAATVVRAMTTMLVLATSVAAAPLAGDVATLPGRGAIIEPARRSDVAVIVYREVLGEIGGADRGPTLTIFGDGRMVAHYPRYMKRAGDYELRLAPSELDALLRSLAAKGVLDFDATATRAATRASMMAARQRALATNTPIQLFEAVDASTTVIEVAVERYVAATPGAREVRNATTRAAWTGLRADVDQHPDVPALRDLAAAEQELRALRERAGFTRVR